MQQAKTNKKPNYQLQENKKQKLTTFTMDAKAFPAEPDLLSENNKQSTIFTTANTKGLTIGEQQGTNVQHQGFAISA